MEEWGGAKKCSFQMMDKESCHNNSLSLSTVTIELLRSTLNLDQPISCHLVSQKVTHADSHRRTSKPPTSPQPRQKVSQRKRSRKRQRPTSPKS